MLFASPNRMTDPGTIPPPKTRFNSVPDFSLISKLKTLILNLVTSGDFSENETLSIGFDYELINGNLLLKESGIGIKQLNAKGNFSMPDIDNNGDSKFNCSIKSASNGSNQIEGNIEVNDFNKPNIKWHGGIGQSA